MKLLLLGDTHITDKKPERRMDEDYLHTLIWQKLDQVEKIYHLENCDALIQVGDWFDHWNVSNRVIAEVIQFFAKLENKIDVYCIWGQHDIAGHLPDTYENSSLRILEEAGIVRVLSARTGPVYLSKMGKQRVILHGCGFAEEVPEVCRTTNEFCILITHQMIGDQPLFPGQSIVHPVNFLVRHKDFDLIVAGDYHYRFIEHYRKSTDVSLEERYCINPGALVRKTISERDLKHEPAVVIFDTDDRSYKVLKLDVASPEKAFDLSAKGSKDEKADDKILLKFLEELKASEGTKIGWKSLLLQVLDETNASEEIRKIIDDCIAEVKK